MFTNLPSLGWTHLLEEDEDMRKFLAATAAMTMGLALAGCGGDDSSEGGGAPAADADLAAAQEYLDPNLENPTSINIDEPLSKKPEADKLIVGLNSGIPSANVLAGAWKQAAEDLGWEYQEVNSGATPTDQQKAMDTAIQLNPDGIATSGIPISTIETQLAEAEEKGIWVNTSASSDAPSGAMYDTSIAGPAQLEEWGRMVAAQTVVQSEGQAKIQLFNLPVFPILLEFDKGFKGAIEEWCPSCELTENAQQATDIGTNTPGAVVSALQQAPDTDWVVFGLAELSTGVPAALQGAQLTDINIAGLSALPENYEALRGDTQDAWTAYPLPIVGYRQIDSFARQFNGDPMVEALLPTQVATPENIDGLVFDDEGNYVGVEDYQAQFQELWQIG
jgi:ribose transport system substrate-binding protein